MMSWTRTMALTGKEPIMMQNDGNETEKGNSFNLKGTEGELKLFWKWSKKSIMVGEQQRHMP